MAHIQERTGANGKTSYRVQIRKRGYATQTATFRRKSDAKKWATDIEARMNAGTPVPSNEARKRTVGDLIDYYIANVLPRKPASAEIQYRQLQFWMKELGDHFLQSITPEDIVRARTKLTEKKNHSGKPLASGTINRYVAPLSHAFTTAIRELGWVTANPVASIPKLKEAPGRTRFLSKEERERLLTACAESESEFLYSFVLVALLTGLRKGEIRGLKWSFIDFENQAIHLPTSKNGAPRSIPLSKHLARVFGELHPDEPSPEQHVFHNPETDGPIDVRRAWRTAVKNAELKNFRFHDLRHSAASYLAMNGASTIEIAEVLGHRTLDMARRYSHLTLEHKRGLMTRLSEISVGKSR